MNYELSDDLQKVVNEFKKQPIPAIVETVRDGSTLRVLLLPKMQVVTFFLSGIRAPSARRDNAPGGETSGNQTAEPFGDEAKYFTESRLLQREVKVILEGTSNNGFVGSVQHPAGNIAEALVSNGLAKCVDWSIVLVTGGPQKLRDAERFAKEKRLRIWKSFEQKEAVKKGTETEFDGTVVRIWSGDTISVVSQATGTEYKLTLSSIRQPKQKDAREGPYAAEAKEFLRSRLIGKRVHVHIEYIRPASDGFEERTCATITLAGINMAEALLNKGLAGVIRHKRDDENRSQVFDALLIAEDK